MIPDPGEERLLVCISALAVVHLKSGHNLKVSSFFFFLFNIHLFGCNRSSLQHVGSSFLTRD